LTTDEGFVVPEPIKDTIAKIQDVDFSQVRNLNQTQIGLICAEGGIHDTSRENGNRDVLTRG